MDSTRLRALAPTDGRYAEQVRPLRNLCSEYGLIRYRVLVEVRWLQALADADEIREVPPLDSVVKSILNGIVDGPPAVAVDGAEHQYGDALPSTNDHRNCRIFRNGAADWVL